jgi:hypothetical protein
MAREEGDLILGALFPVHEVPPVQTAYSRVCGNIREFYGIQVSYELISFCELYKV